MLTLPNLFMSYLKWNEKTITDFSDEKINRMYNDGYVFTRRGKGVMQQTRSIRIDLSQFELSSENRRILRKVEGLNLDIIPLPHSDYSWEIGKLAKDFYDSKFGAGTMSANKVKEMLTDRRMSNFNFLLKYSLNEETIGYAISYANNDIFHYSYPFYNQKPNHPISNPGIGMMTMAIMTEKENKKKYVYLGSFQRPTDTYKLQFSGMEWFDGEGWKNDTDGLKKIME